MANYRCKNNVGPWTAGQIITDDDLKGWPGGGGVKRLRDELGAIEDTLEKPEGAAPAEGVATEIRAEGAGPNAKGAKPPAGKS